MPVFDGGIEPFKKKIAIPKNLLEFFPGITPRTGGGSLIYGYIFKVILEGML